MSKTNEKASIIAIANAKGGVAKSTSVSSVGGYLANIGMDVLLVDLDYQANLSANFLSTPPEKTVFDTFDNGALPIVHVKDHLDLLPSGEDMRILDSLMDSEDDRFILQKALEKVRAKYAVIIIDCPPSLSWATVNAMTACDFLFVPMTADPKSYQGLGLIVPACYQAGTPTRINGIFFTKYEAYLKQTKRIEAKVRAQYGDTVMHSTIRKNVALSECAEDLKDIYEFDRTSNGAKDYAALALEMLDRMGIDPKSKIVK